MDGLRLMAVGFLGPARAGPVEGKAGGFTTSCVTGTCFTLFWERMRRTAFARR